MEKKTNVFALFSLMLVLFLDGLGQGIVFPIYSKALFDTTSPLLTTTDSMMARNIWYGILVGSFFFCWFIGAAVLSDLSDKSGRKKALIICLGGSAIGNIISALAFSMNNIWILLLGRIIVGFTNGSQPIAQASIVDTTPKEKLSRTLGLVVMAVSLGLVGGPLVGGFMSSSHFVSWFTNSTPLYFAGLLAILNILMLLIFYYETSTVHAKVKIHLTRALEIFVSAFKHKSVRYLSITYFFLQTAWSIYYVYISAYMVQNYAISRIEVALFFALVGIGLTFGLAVLSAFFEKRNLDRKHVIFIGFGLLLIATIVTVFTNQAIWAWLVAFPLGAGVGFGYAFILTLFSHQVPSNMQGWVMGITSSLVAFGAGVASMIEGFLSPVNLKLPLYIAIGIVVIGLLLIMAFRSSKDPQSEGEKQPGE